MKSAKLILLATAAVASLAIALTMQQQNVAAFNDNNEFSSNSHGHVNCGTSSCQTNFAGTRNDEGSHDNFNCNSQRAGDAGQYRKGSRLAVSLCLRFYSL